MGMDVAFNRKAALKAGLVVFTDKVGTEESIAQAEGEEGNYPGYLEYLSREREYVQVPNAFHSIENDGVDEIVVRANKWGASYAPLTEWLKANNITWSEF